ncbi:MAG: acetyl-CoA carboxylase biotin carboxyl carrier protein [Oliverpabstia sp.]|nr:acetyl-CoA carboxylase biotin carboxyl carrier protein [Eubacterium sp.]MDY2596278.1 acetyl-CoA carboxylase biotin carboxyl carrier protein [Oliverpabstia sp.]
MEFENLIQLIKTVSSSELTEFSMKDGDFKVSMNKKKEVQIVADGNMAAEIPVFTAQTVAPEKESVESEPEGNQVKAPLVGTFYSASAPDVAPFVKVGDTVKKGQVLGIIEAMKLMNEIESEYEGVVEAILVENGQMVEYGQNLFTIR